MVYFVILLFMQFESKLTAMNTNSFQQSFDKSVLRKGFDRSQIAKKLLPSQNEYLDIDEAPDECQEKTKTQICESKYMTELKNISNLRTWSRISFKEKEVLEYAKETGHKQTAQDENPEKKTYPVTNNEAELRKVMQKFIDEEERFQCANHSNVIDDSCSYSLPLIKNSRKTFFRFYFLDAYEDFSNQQQVYLFGKTYCPRNKKYRSCSVIVSPLNRRLFVIPRNTLFLSENNVAVQKWDIIKEIYYIILKPLGISSFNYRFIWKRKLGAPNVGNNYIVLEIEYSALYPVINQNVEGNTFSEIYGSNSNCLENFILEKKLKGPTWLDVSNPQTSRNSNTWSFFELTCSPANISHCTYNLSQIPPFTLLSLYIQPVEKKKEQKKTINMMSWAVSYKTSNLSPNPDVDKCYCVFVAKKNLDRQEAAFKIFEAYKRTVIKIVNSEKDLLVYFAKQFHTIDPDIIVGFDFQSYQFHLLIDRLVSFNISDISKLGKLKKNMEKMYFKGYLFIGRLICDFKELMNSFISQKKKGLDNLYEHILNIPGEKRFIMGNSLISTTDRHMLSVVLATNESLYLLKLAFLTQIIPSCIKLTNICGNLLSQTFSGSILKRCEFLLLHTFSENGFILPNEPFSNNHNAIADEISGGLVLDPKIGFYDNFILLMDFQSLYPSIIIEFNICLSRPDSDDTNPISEPLGLLPALMEKLMNQRRSVKSVMQTLDKKSFRYSHNHLYQNSLKLCMNGIFGCLASKSFRFSSPAIAQKITSKGREVLKSSLRLLRSSGFEVIYGDTDSMMVNTNSPDLSVAQNLAKHLQRLVNHQYSSIKLDLDSIFKRLIIINKKRYAGVAVTIDVNDQLQYETVLKGLDVRNDWSLYVCQTGKKVIEYILSDLDVEEKISTIKSFLHQMQQDLIYHRVPRTSLLITKYLAQNPKEYSTKSSFHHVLVAIRCMENSVFWFKKGDPVPYIMCRNTDNMHTRKAFHPKELDDYPELVIDESYYLQKQLYPFICNICVPFGIQDYEVAASLGLENMQLVGERKVGNKVDKGMFEIRDPFIFSCQKCKTKNVINHKQRGCTLLTCQNVNCQYCPLENYRYLRNQLVIAIRGVIAKYHRYQTRCNKQKCRRSSFRVALTSACSSCTNGEMKQTYNEMDLFLQLEYFRSLFNSDSFVECAPWIRDANNYIMEALNDFMGHTGFQVVDLSSLFKTF